MDPSYVDHIDTLIADQHEAMPVPGLFAPVIGDLPPTVRRMAIAMQAIRSGADTTIGL
jgi:hypothetical protein